jgi:hypothetical protein
MYGRMPLNFTRFIRASAMYAEKPELSRAEWISVLRLSTRWFFNDLRKLAITQLSSTWMSEIECICLAKEYRVRHWLLVGYEVLVDRLVSPSTVKGQVVSISLQEGKQIGMEVALELSGIAIRHLRNGGNAVTPEDLKSQVLTIIDFGSAWHLKEL